MIRAYIINKYTKLDPTLPRIYNIPCPNVQCTTHSANVSSLESAANTKSEVIYMRYDDTNLKYIYICTTCDTVWKTDDSA